MKELCDSLKMALYFLWHRLFARQICLIAALLITSLYIYADPNGSGEISDNYYQQFNWIAKGELSPFQQHLRHQTACYCDGIYKPHYTFYANQLISKSRLTAVETDNGVVNLEYSSLFKPYNNSIYYSLNSADVSKSSMYQPNFIFDNKILDSLYISADKTIGKDFDRLIATANSLRLNAKGKNELTGEVQLRAQDMVIESELAIADTQAKTVELQKKVYFQQGNLLINSNYLLMKQSTDELFIKDVDFVELGGFRIHAQQLHIEPNIYTVQNGYFTVCEPGEDAWKLSADKIILNYDSNRGEVFYAWLNIFGQPLIPIPYLQFPLSDRQSGILPFSIGLGEGLISRFDIPYYFNLAPNYDLTLTAKYNQLYGLVLENEFRYLNKYGTSVIDYSTLVDDKQTGGNFTEWSLAAGGEFVLDSNWTASLDFTETSSYEYHNNLNDNLSAGTSILYRDAQIAYQSDKTRFSALFYDYQLLIPQTSSLPYHKLPEIQFSYHSAPVTNSFATSIPANIFIDSAINLLPNYQALEQDNRNLFNIKQTELLSYGIESNYTYFVKEIAPENDRNQHLHASRLIMRPSVLFKFSGENYYITPKLAWHSAQYALADSQSASVDMPVTSVDAAWQFVLNDSAESSISAYLIPRFYYVNIPYTEQQDIPLFDTWHRGFSYSTLFVDNHFYGSDRINDANRLSSSLSFQVAEGKKKIFNGSIGVISYNKERKVQMPFGVEENVYTRKTSPYVANLEYHISSNWLLAADYTMDNEYDIEGSRSFALSYNKTHNQRFNLSYTYDQRAQQEFASLSFILPVNERINVLGAHKLDTENSKRLTTIFGLEYNSCCWQARLIAYEGEREYYPVVDGFNFTPVINEEADRGLMFEIALKQLGNLPSIDYHQNDDSTIDIDALLSEHVLGYDHHLEAYHQ